MRRSLMNLRDYVRLIIENYEEVYDHDWMEDQDWNESSVLVPDDIKRAIEKWAIDMKMTTKR